MPPTLTGMTWFASALKDMLAAVWTKAETPKHASSLGTRNSRVSIATLTRATQLTLDSFSKGSLGLYPGDGDKLKATIPVEPRENFDKLLLLGGVPDCGADLVAALEKLVDDVSRKEAVTARDEDGGALGDCGVRNGGHVSRSATVPSAASDDGTEMLLRR